jgi:hypothetical protein
MTHLHRTCGIEWYRKRIKTSEGEWIPVGEGYFRPHKVMVNAVIALKPVEGKRNHWQVIVDHQFEPHALGWLSQTFDDLEVVG